MKVCILIFTGLLTLCQSREARLGVKEYHRYQVYAINATTQSQHDILRKLYREYDGKVDFWTRPQLNRRTDVMVAPEAQKDFQELLANNGISYEVKIKDVQNLIMKEKTQNNRIKKRSADNQKIGWDYYMRFDEIEEFVRNVERDHGDIATVKVIGTTYENRNIYAVKISNSTENKKAILIDANIHAREWITSATATWIINELVTNRQSPHHTGINWFIIPMVNADGYEYTHTTDRTWRKSRSINSGSHCRGCDINRNFPFIFGGEGTSSNPCSNLFKGSTPLSEKEAAALASYMHELKNDSTFSLEAYISFHSYGQLWLLPWGYNAEARPDDFEDQESLGNNVVSAIYGVNETLYTSGAGADILYGVGGASDDYAKYLGIKYSVTAEMRDSGEYGFLLPADQIEVNAREIFSGLREVAYRVNPR